MLVLGANSSLGLVVGALSCCVLRASSGCAVVALPGGVVRGVPAEGGLADGGGVRFNCLPGVKAGLIVLLSLLTGFFPFLLLVAAWGGMLALPERGGVG